MLTEDGSELRHPLGWALPTRVIGEEGIHRYGQPDVMTAMDVLTLLHSIRQPFCLNRTPPATGSNSKLFTK
jgi:hypothetical protein